jgi:uncharacterized small protein (DUF1192 family)
VALNTFKLQIDGNRTNRKSIAIIAYEGINDQLNDNCDDLGLDGCDWGYDKSQCEAFKADAESLKTQIHRMQNEEIDSMHDLFAERDVAVAEVERLKAELSKHQMSEFHPDWSLLEASIDNNGECDIEIKRLTKGCQELESEVERLKAESKANYRLLKSAVAKRGIDRKERDEYQRLLGVAEELLQTVVNRGASLKTIASIEKLLRMIG